MSIKLSILVPTVPNRIDNFYLQLMKELLYQIKPYSDIELLGLFDNRKRLIGKKRDEMLDLAQGEYLVFIDDDDRITSDYVKNIMDALYANPNTDCVVFDCICSVNSGPQKLCKYGIEFEYGDILGGKEWRGKPAHTMVYRSSIAKKHRYTNMHVGEDVDWVIRACKDIKVQTRIDKVLYYYDAEGGVTSEFSNLDQSIIRTNIERKFNLPPAPAIKTTNSNANGNFKVSIACLIYKSVRWLKFVKDQVERYTNLDENEFYFVANDACDEVLSYLKENNIPHYIHNNSEEQKKDWYINNVYRAWNTAGRVAKGEYVVFINSDMAFSNGWLDRMMEKYDDSKIISSRLVERGVLRTGLYGIEKNFGNVPGDYKESEFNEYSKCISESRLEESGLYMPCLIKKKYLEQINFYPEGNVRPESDIFNPIYAKPGEPLISGDKIFIERLNSIGITHWTAFDSIVYHFQEGEMRDEL